MVGQYLTVGITGVVIVIAIVSMVIFTPTMSEKDTEKYKDIPPPGLF